ncbi:MAG: HEAT repeat protein [uncultured archaeon A07HN63]|nr:MAG: HEAT repeat protein [uncultured archaeon A07HN63]
MTDQDQHVDTAFLEEIAFNGQYDQLRDHLLENAAPAVRHRAAELFTEYSTAIGDDRVETITGWLVTAAAQEPHDGVRAQIIEALLDFDDGAIDDLVAAIADADRPTPTDTSSPQVFFDWLGSHTAELRLVAVAGLGEVGSSQVVPKLATACSDRDARVRRRAIIECGRVGDDRCVGAVAANLDSEDEAIRLAAADALMAIGSEKALRALLPAAKSGDTALRQRAMKGIGTLGSLQVLGTLLRGLDDENAEIRQAAATAIIRLVAKAPSDESHRVRETVAEQLTSVPNRDVVAEFLTLFTDTDEAVIRRNTAWVLGRIADDDPRADVIRCLVRAIDDADDRTAQVAASSLVRIGEPAIIDELESFVAAADLGTKALSRADFIRNHLTDSEAEERLKNAVEYVKVSDPGDYTRKKAGGKD